MTDSFEYFAPNILSANNKRARLAPFVWLWIMEIGYSSSRERTQIQLYDNCWFYFNIFSNKWRPFRTFQTLRRAREQQTTTRKNIIILFCSFAVRVRLVRTRSTQTVTENGKNNILRGGCGAGTIMHLWNMTEGESCFACHTAQCHRSALCTQHRAHLTPVFSSDS